MTIKKFATLDEAKRNTENSRSLNLAAVKRLRYPLRQKFS